MRIHDLINEIQELKNSTPRKAAFDIFTMLENNKALFVKAIDIDVYAQILKDFEKMAYSNAKEFESPAFKEDFQKTYNQLQFYLNRIN